MSVSGKKPSEFRHRLLESRLGQSHPSLDSFRQAVTHRPSKTKEFTLVVVTSSPSRILLGLKHRGFGKGMYNSFGGKFDHPEETPADCACRELQEETNISITPEAMRNAKVGVQRYTFEEDPTEMIMHVFWVHLPSDCPAFADIRPCEEITPEWFADWREIPLYNMFADDSHWLVTLLSSKESLEINGSYHFRENCQETNTILHYTMDVKTKAKYTLEQRLFHAIHDNQIHSLSVKEFKECFAFQQIVRSSFAKPRRAQWDVVIDVAGGHGALAAMFLICTTATKAVVVDPAQVGQGGVEKAWNQFYGGKQLAYRHECLRTGVPAELEEALKITTPDRILVVACHACQHLSEETLEIALRYGVHAAAMPCCQKDLSPGSSWKAAGKNLSIEFAKVMDLLLAGKLMAAGTHDVRMKLMDPKITPQNRIIVCRTLASGSQTSQHKSSLAAAHVKLEAAYRKAHAILPLKRASRSLPPPILSAIPPSVMYLGAGFVAGVVVATSISKRLTS